CAVHAPSRRAHVPAGFLFRTPRRPPIARPWHGRPASSDPAPRQVTRSRRRGGQVLEASPAGPPPTFPNGPIATPEPHRSRGGAQLPATSPAVAVAKHRYRPPSLAVQSSSPGAQHTPAGRGSAKVWSVGRW